MNDLFMDMFGEKYESEKKFFIFYFVFCRDPELIFMSIF